MTNEIGKNKDNWWSDRLKRLKRVPVTPPSTHVLARKQADVLLDVVEARRISGFRPEVIASHLLHTLANISVALRVSPESALWKFIDKQALLLQEKIENI